MIWKKSYIYIYIYMTWKKSYIYISTIDSSLVALWSKATQGFATTKRTTWYKLYKHASLFYSYIILRNNHSRSFREDIKSNRRFVRKHSAKTQTITVQIQQKTLWERTLTIQQKILWETLSQLQQKTSWESTFSGKYSRRLCNWALR